MPTSIWEPDVQAVFEQARSPRTKTVQLADRSVEIPTPFPSPEDWRDKTIYFMLVDRFNNPRAQPRFSWDGEHGVFQGGTFDGIRQQLDYLQEMGVGALWLSPVLKNCQYRESYHGYGIQDFLAVDPRFASDPQNAEQELRDLIDEAHARGIHVIFDIVLNHGGDVFEYECRDGDGLCRDTGGSEASRSDQPYTILWRDETGHGRPDWTEAPESPSADAAVWPRELRRNVLFRRQGVGDEAGGDFASLKELVTDFHEVQRERGLYYPARDTLIRACQYLIARYDVDGFRVDTLKYIEPDFARIFGNAIREYALSIGKKHFFTFGEVYDNEEKIAHFIGRNAMEPGDLIGVDAALDFPLFYRLPSVAKGLAAPAEVIAVFEHRKQVHRGILSAHSEASQYFVTFLDNHDQYQRFYYRDPNNPHQFDDQVTVGIGCLFSLQGIPCLYYGTEQGLHRAGGTLEAVREALWGKPNAFDGEHPFYRAIQRLAEVRRRQPALRYGRQYFRPLSGDGVHFGVSQFPSGILAFSRILQDDEVIVLANTNTQNSWTGEVIVDFALNPVDSIYRVAFSNHDNSQVTPPGPLTEKAAGSVVIREVNGAVTHGPARVLRVNLRPMEIQILARRL